MKPVLTSATVSVDFGILADHPLSHDRIALFNSGLVTLPSYERDRAFFRRTSPEHLRIDLGWGAEWMPWHHELVHLVDGEPVYDFAETDAIAHFLNDVDVRPYWSYSYVPAAARPVGGDWRTMAADNRVWVDMVTEYVRGAADRGVSIGYHEIYNEPDLRDERTGEPVFYAGDLADYLDLYRQTSRAIRAADPNARIGGPALASVNANGHWLHAFLEMVAAENLPLDFLSFHHYGTYGLAPALQTVVSVLADFPQFAHVELHLNEYNSFVIDYPRGGPQDSHFLAAAFAADLELLLGTPSLTRTSWAQFLDSGNDNYSGMIDISGQSKPLFSAYEFYQSMPIDRRQVRVDGPAGLGAIASANAEASAVLLWNRSTTSVAVTLELAGVDDAELIVIDSTGDDTRRRVRGPAVMIPLERGAVALLRQGDSAGATSSRIVRRSRYEVSDRKSRAWTDVDEATATIRFGTADDPDTHLRAGFDVPAELDLTFSTTASYADGKPAPGTVVIEEEMRGDIRTVWASLHDAPSHVFARVDTAVAGRRINPRRPEGSQ